MSQVCTICQEDLGSHTTTSLECGHGFHVSCILAWARSSNRSHGACPVCRSGQTGDDDDEEFESQDEDENQDDDDEGQDTDENQEDDELSNLTEEELHATRELHLTVLEREARRADDESQLKVWYDAMRRSRRKRRSAERKLRDFDDRHVHLHRKRRRLLNKLERREDKVEELKQVAWSEFAVEAPVR